MSDITSILIRNGDVANPEGFFKYDMAIQNGKIVAIDKSLPERAAQVLDATNKLVFPGFIDAHTHMGIPIMNTHSCDDFASGSIAAACGGVTTIGDFTVQEPGQSLRESVEIRLAKARKSHIDFALHVNVTDAPEKNLLEIPELVQSGLTAFKVFSTYRQAGMMVTWPQFRQVLKTVAENDGILCLHAEDNDLVESMTEQHVQREHFAAIYHPRSRTAEAEALAITKAAEIAGELQAPLYIVHLSSRAGLEAARAARSQGVRLYLETCPQYLALDESFYQRENGHWWITTPPLRTREDREALWQALANDEIDVVATDHCPFTIAQKEAGNGQFHLTPNGIPGVETLFPLLYTYGVTQGRISLQKLVQVLAENPARIFGLAPRKGSLQAGAEADLVIFDPQATQTIRAADLHGNADWSPYENLEIQGKIEHVFLRGNLIVENGEFVGKNIFGEHLEAQPHTASG